jgi:glyoxylase-like metal-dependent hydrolase (beta-lactamase superfamily II)
MSASAAVQAFFDDKTGTVSYVIADTSTRWAAIVDPVLDFDFRSGSTSTVQADKIVAYMDAEGLRVEWILETHAHADHLSAAYHLQQRLGGRVAIGERIRQVQATFRKVYNLERTFLPDGRQFDHLFQDGERFRIGSVDAQALLVPGHTPADMAYAVDGNIFVGDTLFMPDVGTARADFPGGDARTLYRSIRRLLAYPPDTKVFVCHDYPPEGRAAAWESTVAEQRAANIHVASDIGEEQFVLLRHARDATLEVPALILPSIQVNIRAGRMPPPEDDGVSYLKIPLNVLGTAPAHRAVDV